MTFKVTRALQLLQERGAHHPLTKDDVEVAAMQVGMEFSLLWDVIFPASKAKYRGL